MIPKRAYFVYGEACEENPLPEKASLNITDFVNHNVGWFANIIDYDSPDFGYDEIFGWNKLAWSQVMRFELISKYGGLYSDVDIEYYGPVPHMLDCDLVLAVERHGDVSDAFFAAVPNHPLMIVAREKALKWCEEKMASGVKEFTTEEMFKGCGVMMFSQLAKEMTGLKFEYEKQVHMTQRDFAGRFHPENGVGILPFEALCRHNNQNWVGWHQCWGTWRPRTEDNKADMRMEACIKTNG